MRTPGSLARPKNGRRWLLGVIPALALAAGVIVPSVATASTVHSKPYFFVWKAGTTLPQVPAGYVLMAWPPQQVLQTLKVGDTVPAALLTTNKAATTSAAATSASAVNPAPAPTLAMTAASLTAFANPAGDVNLELIPDSVPGAVPDSCIPSLPQFRADEGSHATNVMQSYSTINGTLQKFNYGVGQSTTVGVGVSGSGNNGTYTGSGTAGISDTGHTQQFWPNQSNRSFNHWQTFFEWGKYYVYNSCPQLDHYEIFPNAWNAGDAFVHPSGAPGATHCTPELKGGGLTQSSTTATTFGVGFTVLGFSGSAQTGYSTNASIGMFFPNTAGQLCGVNGTPPNNPGILVES